MRRLSKKICPSENMAYLAGTYLPERYQPQLVSTYSSNDTSPPCKEWLKPNVAQSQKIQLKDEVHTLYVTATLCSENIHLDYHDIA